MDNLEESNISLTNSYFLSSTTNTYNELLHEESSINLSDILKEFHSILSLSNDFEESKIKERIRPSIIIAGSHLSYECCEELNISQVRKNQTFSDISNKVNRLSLSGIQFSMEKVENSICSERIKLMDDCNIMSNSGNHLKMILDRIPNNYENIENELCPIWDSIIDKSFDEDKSNHLEYKQNAYPIPDIISKVLEGTFVDDYDEHSKTNSMHLFSVQNTTSNFFTRRKKKKYFLSPKKLIWKYRCEEIGDASKILNNLSLNDSSHSKNFGTNLDEEEKRFHEIVNGLSSFCLENITIPEWPLFDEMKEEDESEESSYNTSTPLGSEPSVLQFFNSPLSPVRREENSINSPLKFDFGVSCNDYFSRRKGLNYFSTPK